jgi:serine/threonine protein kinase
MSLDNDLGELYRYDVDTSRPVGKGGCGTVWRATDRLFDRAVAIKTISDDFGLLHTPEAARAFRFEAIAGARLGQLSKHIVGVFDFGRTIDTLYFTMEWIEPSLSGRIDISPLMGNVGLAEARKILRQAIEGLGIAHTNGVIHSDIAPWNIVFDPYSTLYKLADFGLLKIVESQLIGSPSGTLLHGGRRAFLPPYARDDIRQVSPASDVYAMAVTFWCLLEGDAVLSRQTDEPPSVVRIRRSERDAPYEVVRLLERFITHHTTSDATADLLAYLQEIPTR